MERERVSAAGVGVTQGAKDTAGIIPTRSRLGRRREILVWNAHGIVNLSEGAWRYITRFEVVCLTFAEKKGKRSKERAKGISGMQGGRRQEVEKVKEGR